MSQYSPYNKTYRYLLFQNQAYHERNKRNASPEVKTNLKHSMSRISPVKNPQNNFEAIMYRSTRSQSTYRSHKQAPLFTSDNQIKNVMIDQPPKLIHMNKSFQKFEDVRVEESNGDLVDRMIKTRCTVVKKQKALNSFEKHRQYQQIRTKFTDQGNRKESFSLGNKSLLCPTLAQYMKSGLGQSFLLNLSVSNNKKRLSARLNRKNPDNQK